LVKVLDGEGRWQVNKLKPERMDPSQTPLRRSARRAAAKAPSHHLQQGQPPFRTATLWRLIEKKLERIPQVWNNLDHEVLHQQEQHIDNFIPFL